MTMFARVWLIAVLGSGLVAPQRAAAQATTEERFHDLFITAGYATAFGAAMGAALLSFHEEPQNHLRYIAVGASLGFIGGSLLGTYFIFAPALLGEDMRLEDQDMLVGVPDRGIVIRPVYDVQTRRVSAFETGMTLLKF